MSQTLREEQERVQDHYRAIVQYNELKGNLQVMIQAKMDNISNWFQKFKNTPMEHARWAKLEEVYKSLKEIKEKLPD